MKVLAEAFGWCVGFFLGAKLGLTLIETCPPWGAIALYALVSGIMVWRGLNNGLFRKAVVAIRSWNIWQSKEFLLVKDFLAARRKADGNSDRK